MLLFCPQYYICKHITQTNCYHVTFITTTTAGVQYPLNAHPITSSWTFHKAGGVGRQPQTHISIYPLLANADLQCVLPSSFHFAVASNRQQLENFSNSKSARRWQWCAQPSPSVRTHEASCLSCLSILITINNKGISEVVRETWRGGCEPIPQHIRKRRTPECKSGLILDRIFVCKVKS